VSRLNAAVEAELDAALIPLRAEGLSAQEAAQRLPAHLVQPYWSRQVDAFLGEELAKMEGEAP